MHSGFSFMDRLANGIARATPRRRIEITLERPIVSFSFDDVPETALSNGARILEDHGARGTFYVAGALAGGFYEGQAMLTSADYRELANRGHEIAHHTFSHMKPRELGWGYAADLDLNDDFLEDVTGERVRNFAFPYGLSAPRVQHELGRRFRSGRSAQKGINRGTTDLDYLWAVDVNVSTTEPEALQWIADAAKEPGWLIYLTHDVKDPPSPFGCRPAMLTGMVEAALAAGAEILTVDKALDRLGAPK